MQNQNVPEFGSVYCTYRPSISGSISPVILVLAYVRFDRYLCVLLTQYVHTAVAELKNLICASLHQLIIKKAAVRYALASYMNIL